jgi:hypothetical protein
MAILGSRLDSKQTPPPSKILKVAIEKLYYALCDFGHQLWDRDEKNYDRHAKLKERVMVLIEKLLVLYKISDKEKQMEGMLKKQICSSFEYLISYEANK